MMSAIINPFVSRAPDPDASESVAEMEGEGETKEAFAEVLAPQTKQAASDNMDGDTPPVADPSTRATPAADRPEMASRSLVSRPATAGRLASAPAAAEFFSQGQNPMAKDAGAPRKLAGHPTLGSKSKMDGAAGAVLVRTRAGDTTSSNADGLKPTGVTTAAGSLTQMGLPGQSQSAAPNTALNSALTPALITALTPATVLATGMNQSLGQGGVNQAMTFSVPQQVGAEGWSQQLGDKILTVMRADLGEAVINLAPEELGPVKVSLTVMDGEVRLQWVAHASETRQALEQAIPRLREMFAQEGLQLADSQVSSGGQQDSPRNLATESHVGREAVAERNETADSGAESARVVTVSRHAGLLDLYA